MRAASILAVWSVAWFAGQLAAADPNRLTPEEQQAGFQLLFNGKDLEGWQHNGNWAVSDGAIARTDRGGNLTYKTRKVPDNFELRFQWKVGEGSNSGVYYRPGQYEYQILDNAKHADGKHTDGPRRPALKAYATDEVWRGRGWYDRKLEIIIAGLEQRLGTS